MTAIDLGGRQQWRDRNTTVAVPRRTRLLYEEVIDLVEQLVVELRLSPGDLLPTQSQLAKRAGVSLISVRRALDELERAGRVRRHQGVGTFLAQPKIVSEPTISGSLGNTLAASVDHSRISTKLLDLTRVHPSANLAAALLRTETDYLWQVRRQRLLDDDPIMLETALIPVELAPDLDKYRLALVGSFYELLANQYKLEDDYEEQYLEVVSPSLEERQLLKLTPRAQVVRIRGLSVDTSGTPFDCFEQVYPAANFMFGMLGSTSRRLLLESASLGWYVRPLPPSPPGDAAANTKDGSPAFRKSENQ